MRRRAVILGLAVALAVVLAGPASAARLTHSERRAVAAVLDRYVPAALERKDLRVAYELSGPYVRGGMTLREWLHGGIPIYPYPARSERHDGFTVDWRDGADVGLSLLLQPRPGAKVGPIAFDVQMRREHGRWLVNAFLPRASFAPAGKPAKVFSERDLLPGGRQASSESGRLSPLWFALPGAFLGGLVLLVPGYVVYTRRRDARAYREYLQLHGEA